MINEEIARKTLSLEVKAAKVTGKLLLTLLKKLGGLEKLVKVNGNEVKLKDMAKKGQLEEIPVKDFRARMEEGKRVSPSVPYGYYRNPKNKQELLVDKESSKVVKRIYRLVIEGYGPTRVKRNELEL